MFLERRLKDKRFRKNEESILDVYLGELDDLTMKKIAKRAGISRSTVYEHHHAIKEIVLDYERYILKEYTRIVRERSQKEDVPLKSFYLDMLLFILKNKKVFRMFLKLKDREIIMKMFGELEDKIIEDERLPKNSTRMLRILKSEMAEIIFEWGEKGFPKKEVERVRREIVYLSETALKRLERIR